MVVLTKGPGYAAEHAVRSSFRRWQSTTLGAGKLPLIGIAGTRGKSTVVRLVDAIFTSVGLRTATWTNRGVEVGGRHQRGELSGWSRALSQVSGGTIDVAIQELDWATVNAVGLPSGTYPIVAVTNLCGNSEACLADEQTRPALRALPTVVNAVHDDGTVVINGDDHDLVDSEMHLRAETVLTVLSSESPIIRARVATGRPCLWIADGMVTVSTEPGEATTIVALDEVPLTLGGEAKFEVSNLLTAVAVALGTGLDSNAIRRGVSGFRSHPGVLPGSFNLYDIEGTRAVVDCLNPAWFLRPVLRAVNPGGRLQLVTVIGSLDSASAQVAHELGRLLGRYRGAVIVHSTKRERVLDAFRRGLADNSIPPLIVRLPTERRALNRGLKALRPGSLLLVLTDEPDLANRALERRLSTSDLVSSTASS